MKVQQMLTGGEFGDCGPVIESYNHRCSELFPLAVAFKPPPEVSTPETETSGGDELSENSSMNPCEGKDELSGGQD